MSGAFLQTLSLGLKSLLLQKMRSALAALGIFIGTTTVIWLVAMGEGVSHRAQEQIKELGATNIILRTKRPNAAGEGHLGRPRPMQWSSCGPNTQVPHWVRLGGSAQVEVE